MPARVLVVCTANICRSPAAAALLWRELGEFPELEVASAAGRTDPAALTGCG